KKPRFAPSGTRWATRLQMQMLQARRKLDHEQLQLRSSGFLAKLVLEKPRLLRRSQARAAQKSGTASVVARANRKSTTGLPMHRSCDFWIPVVWRRWLTIQLKISPLQKKRPISF